jgi:hypothetical protein
MGIPGSELTIPSWLGLSIANALIVLEADPVTKMAQNLAWLRTY